MKGANFGIENLGYDPIELSGFPALTKQRGGRHIEALCDDDQLNIRNTAQAMFNQGNGILTEWSTAA